MDIPLAYVDPLLSRYVYPDTWLEEHGVRQLLSLTLLTVVGGLTVYISTASLCYWTLFNETSSNHPLYIPHQVVKEIRAAVWSIGVGSVVTSIVFWLEVQGYSKLYTGIYRDTSQYGTFLVQAIGYILFTDMTVYWLHRALHHRYMYSFVHKRHHRWKVPTPFAGQSCNVSEAIIMSSPYHIFPFVFPLEKRVYLLMFAMINVWTVLIHSGEFRLPRWTWPYITNSQHHDLHHLEFNYNYGQYFTFWDHVGRSYKKPAVESRQ